jgi:hypothetical protein
MATYVPGSEQYLPDIKPFTPDYKFLSAVLDVRQDKYNTNWQATNDVYNKVVFADMSRQDTNSQREQYVNNLAPALEKISGMDLSLAQNVQSAKSVFAPFFEDKLIVKDIVKTANYRKEMGYAERLLASPDPTVNRQYWRDGVAELQYRMEDFINMDPDAALNTSLYKYVPAPNLFEIAEDILSEQKPPLSIKYDVLSPDGEWIITKKNGELLVGPALKILRNQLATDGRIIRSYQTKAYVASRDFAAAGMEAGDFNSVEEGQDAWAQSTISNIEFNNEQRLKTGLNAIAEQREINVRWDNYKKQYGIVPGSVEEKIMNDQLTAYEKTKLELENQIDIKKVINTPSNNLETTLNRAYQLVMMTNLDSDMIKAAESFSMRDMESTRKENPYEIQRRNFQNDKDLLRMRFANDREVAAAEAAKAAADKKGVEALVALGQGGVNTGNAQTIAFATDKEGKIEANSDVLQTSYKQYNEDEAEITNRQIGAIINSLILLKPKGDAINGKFNNEYTIKVEGGTFTGTREKLQNMMNQKNSDGSFVYKKQIDELYNQQANAVLGIDSKTKTLNVFKTNPGVFENNEEEFKKLHYNMSKINENITTVDMNFKIAKELYKENYAVAENMVKDQNEDVKGMMAMGMPGLYKEGSNIPMTQDEYVQLAIKKVKAGELKNYNRSGIDGTNDPNYMGAIHPRDVEYLKLRGRLNDNAKLDVNEITKEAKIAYNALYEGLNNWIITGGNGGTYNSIKEGRTGTLEDASIGYTIGGTFNAKFPEGQGYNEFVNLVNQTNSLNFKGVKPIVYFGQNINDDLAITQQTAFAFMDKWKTDVINHLSDEKASGVPPSVKIEYGSTLGPVDGGGTKTTAGYIIKPDSEYLKSIYITSGMTDEQKQAANNIINTLSGGFSMVYDKDEDLNPSAEKSNYGHPILANIMASENGIFKTDVIIDGHVVGDYSFEKGVNNNSYIVNTTSRTFNPTIKDWVESTRTDTYDIINNNFIALDEARQLADDVINFLGNQSMAEYKKYTQINGQK